jgi:hypothetical protein
MLKPGAKFFTILTTVLMLSNCIDPYSPTLKGYESLLVVEGLITDENTSYTVKLSRTIQQQDGIPVMVSDATVYITDDEAKKTILENSGEGIYKTNSTLFKGVIGESYALHIITREGDEFESDQCLMTASPNIDSIYFAKDTELVNNGTESKEGLRIFLDSKDAANDNYYRWDFEETWKFKVPNPQKYDYISETLIVQIPDVNEYCWKIRHSNEILIHSNYSGGGGRVEKEPIFFIDTEKSDRLLIQYNILVKQYSISKKEYDFWNNMKQINENGSDIFSTQPFPVISNIRNINNPGERVLGYFRVSAVKQKIKNIPFSDIVKLNLPYFNYSCERIEMAPQDYPRSPLAPPLTWDDLYAMYCITSDYYFVEPRYKPGTEQLEKLVFSRPECADCEKTGTKIKPDFWIDSN